MKNYSDIIDTPPVMYAMLGNVAPTSHVDLVQREDKVKVRITAGKMDTYDPSYEPPTTDFDYGLFDGFIDGVIAGDDSKVCDIATKIYAYELNTVQHARKRSALSKSESNVEHCFFQDRVSFQSMSDDLNVEKTVLINPSKGTMKRFHEHQFATPLVVMLDDMDKDQCRDIKLIADEFQWEYNECAPDDLDDNSLYYLSFNASLGSKLGLTHYVGFEPNPLQLALRGSMHEMIRGDRFDEYVYYRYTQERRLKYNVRSTRCNVYPSDYLFERYTGRTGFRYNQPLMHDLYSTVDIYKTRGPVLRASIMPYNCRFVIGSEYSHDRRGIIRNGAVVLRAGATSWATRNIPACAQVYDDVGLGFQRASYVISMYGSLIVFLGHKRFLKQVTGVEQRYLENYFDYDIVGSDVPRSLRGVVIDSVIRGPGTFYRDVSPADADIVVVQRAGGDYKSRNEVYTKVEYVELPGDISQVVGAQTFCTSTYQTIVGIKLLYVRQDGDGLVAPNADLSEIL